jgi:hypothetical protein
MTASIGSAADAASVPQAASRIPQKIDFAVTAVSLLV